jgi:hypothetical protein
MFAARVGLSGPGFSARFSCRALAVSPKPAPFRLSRALRVSSSSRRHLATAAAAAAHTDSPTPAPAHTPADAPLTTVAPGTYAGPLSATFRRLKLFSLSSLTLSFTLTPFLFIVESALPLSARFALAGTALATSGISTALVSWAGKPYVTRLARLPDGAGVDMRTLTLALRERATRVYDTTFLIETKRPFAKWELAETVALDKAGAHPLPTAGTEETVAETVDVASGAVVGRWIVRWGEGGVGTCRETGKVVRYVP